MDFLKIRAQTHLNSVGNVASQQLSKIINKDVKKLSPHHNKNQLKGSNQPGRKRGCNLV